MYPPFGPPHANHLARDQAPGSRSKSDRESFPPLLSSWRLEMSWQASAEQKQHLGIAALIISGMSGLTGLWLLVGKSPNVRFRVSRAMQRFRQFVSTTAPHNARRQRTIMGLLTCRRSKSIGSTFFTTGGRCASSSSAIRSLNLRISTSCFST